MFTIVAICTNCSKTFETFAACKAYAREQKVNAYVFSHKTGKYCYVISNRSHFGVSKWYAYDSEEYHTESFLTAYNTFLAKKADRKKVK